MPIRPSKLMLLMTVPTLGLILALALCGNRAARADHPNMFSAQEWAVVKTLSALPEKPPLDWTNAFADDPLAAQLGQELFFEPAIAGPLLVGADKAFDLSGN